MKVTLASNTAKRDGESVTKELNSLINSTNFFKFDGQKTITWGTCANTLYTNLIGFLFLYLGRAGISAHDGYPVFTDKSHGLFITNMQRFGDFVFSIGDLKNIKIETN